jgi:hypothetical protein
MTCQGAKASEHCQHEQLRFADLSSDGLLHAFAVNNHEC